MTPEEVEQWRAAREVAKAERAAAAAEQAARVEAALANGGPGSGPDVALRVVVDCSFAPSASPKEVRGGGWGVGEGLGAVVTCAWAQQWV